MDRHLQDIAQILNDLKCDSATGLSTAEAASRLASQGRNELLDRGGSSPWRILWEQCTSTMALILTAAACLAAVAGSFRDSLTIMAINQSLSARAGGIVCMSGPFQPQSGCGDRHRLPQP
jgi:magnesium-transporting ATPase (P-type)